MPKKKKKKKEKDERRRTGQSICIRGCRAADLEAAVSGRDEKREGEGMD